MKFNSAKQRKYVMGYIICSKFGVSPYSKQVIKPMLYTKQGMVKQIKFLESRGINRKDIDVAGQIIDRDDVITEDIHKAEMIFLKDRFLKKDIKKISKGYEE